MAILDDAAGKALINIISTHDDEYSALLGMFAEYVIRSELAQYDEAEGGELPFTRDNLINMLIMQFAARIAKLTADVEMLRAEILKLRLDTMPKQKEGTDA